MTIPSIKPKDVIAVILVVGFVVVKLKTQTNELDAIVALIVGYYFGHRKSGTDTGN
jgi:hypothetical protein